MSVGFARVPQPSGTRSPPLKRGLLQASSWWRGRKELCCFISQAQQLCPLPTQFSQGTAHHTHLHSVFLGVVVDVDSSFSTKQYTSPSHPGLSAELQNTGAWMGRFVAE